MTWKYDEIGVKYDQPLLLYDGSVFSALLDYIVMLRRKRRM